ncbi:ABC transporter ATP-binding protein [Actibacterium pelagium]|uniref:Multidrug ABC transporter ATPase n=1 Tax=Actibacterium pelagium TaxID=2029103 RepID=A0A917AJ00_9RHOB|nr:ABC transporter ATP-binding protein [Actibacterium pelagium]GGE55604.1 multidrug ABC transporter ATPase [Actibacterium pelagium]
MKIENLIDAFRPAEGPPPQSLLAFMRWCLSGAWPWLGGAVILSMAVGTMDVVTALILGRVVDLALETGVEGFWATNGPILAAFVLFFLVFRPLVFAAAATMNEILIRPNITPLILSRLYRWTLGQSITFFENDFAGRLAQKQMQTARATTQVTNEMISVVTFAVSSFVGSVLLLLAIDFWVALILAIWLAGYLNMIRWFMPRIRSRSKAQAGARAMVTGQVVDTITNSKTVKLFATSEFEDQEALAAMDTFRHAAVAHGKVAATFRLTLTFVAGLIPVLLVGASLILWSRGSATPGDVVAAGAIAIRISQMTGWLSFALMGVYSNIGEVEDGMRTLTSPYDLTDAENAKELVVSKGEIHFDNVSFAYGRQVGGVNGINLTIHPGEKLGIVGASGAGKSTLVSLLLRLYDTEAGTVSIDGTDLRDVTQESLRRQIAMVTQETAMFNRSARDNIIYGNPEASEDQMIDAARRAEAHEFILGLKDHKDRAGYQAHLGEQGVKLSGGQRQRIALARAFLKDAPILVLDEATSALDSEVEAAIQDSLSKLMEGKTVLAIAHRLSTISAMDRIIVMEDGQIVEEGSHDALLAKGGLYARFWARQSGGFIQTEAAE